MQMSRASPFLWFWNRKDDNMGVIYTSHFPQVTSSWTVTAIQYHAPLSLHFMPSNSHFITDFTKPRMERKPKKKKWQCSVLRQIQKNVLSFKLSFYTCEVSSSSPWVNNLPYPDLQLLCPQNRIVTSYLPEGNDTGPKDSLNCQFHHFIKTVFYKNTLWERGFMRL